MPQSNPKAKGVKSSESSGLLASHYEEMSDEEMGEEDSFLQSGQEGVEMQSGLSSKTRNDEEVEGDDGTTTLLR